MASLRAVMPRAFVMLFLTFMIKKPIVHSDSVCYSFGYSFVGITEEIQPLLVFESIFTLQSSKCLSLKPKLALQLLLLLSGDVEICPGPIRSIPESLLSSRGMHIFHQNIRNLLNKKDQIMEIMNSFKNFQILTLSETHINKKC